MAEEDKASIDINAEKQYLDPYSKSMENMMMEESDFLNSKKEEQIEPELQQLPVVVANEFNFTEYQPEMMQTSESEIKSESFITGINYNLDINEIENIKDTMAKSDSNFKDLASNVANISEELYGLATKEKQEDPFEERITVLPTNLIFYNRISRIVM